MSYRAKVVKVVIASPSDIVGERHAVRNILQEWNNAHSEHFNIVLMPVDWESHSAPASGDRPQGIINKQVLAGCDLLVAIFWTKLGTPTGKAASGTVEEIEEHIKLKKPAMIYFSSIPVVPESIDQKQYQALQEFKAQLGQRLLYAEYKSTDDFREKFSRQLAQTVIRYFAAKKNGDVEAVDYPIAHAKVPELSEPASTMLIVASEDSHGAIFTMRSSLGLTIYTNGANLVENLGPRSAPRWEKALGELCNKRLLHYSGPLREAYSVTDEGYRVANLLKEKQLAPSWFEGSRISVFS